MFRSWCRVVTLGVLAAAVPGGAWASAVIQSMNGDVRVGMSAQVMMVAREGQRLPAGTTIVTGPDAQVVLKFDDEGQVVLNQNTEFRMVDSLYVRSAPEADRATFDLVKGSLRAVTGMIGARSRAAWALRTPHATIQVRGTDFMVAVTNQTFVQVTHGAIEASNGYDKVVFGSGQTGSIASSSSMPTAIQSSALPDSVARSFGAMTNVAGVTPGGTSAGAGSATGGLGSGVGLGAAVGIGAAAAAAAAAAGDGSTTSTHH